MRSKRTRWPPASTMAILTGLRNSLARCLLASSTLRAISTDMLTPNSPLKSTVPHKDTSIFSIGPIVPQAQCTCNVSFVHSQGFSKSVCRAASQARQTDLEKLCVHSSPVETKLIRSLRHVNLLYFSATSRWANSHSDGLRAAEAKSVFRAALKPF